VQGQNLGVWVAMAAISPWVLKPLAGPGRWSVTAHRGPEGCQVLRWPPSLALYGAGRSAAGRWTRSLAGAGRRGLRCPPLSRLFFSSK
jgi:hypothetical protein